jgi:uncharacterized protein (UPF0332 family)
MVDEEKIALIQHRVKKSKETLIDASLLFNNRRLSAAVNRIYYALFYSVSALLLTNNLSSAKHTGVKSLFHKHFVLTGKVDNESGRLFSIMFDFRHKSDYDDYVEFEQEKVKEWLVKTERVIHILEQAINKELETRTD